MPADPQSSVPLEPLSNGKGTARAECLVRWCFHPLAHFTALTLLAGYFLGLSWRRWPDPVVDFGRELYIPWQLAQGAVLYRDVDDFYGPLSQYLNSGLFAIFGPGVMVLVIANLVVLAGIVTLAYRLVRKAWGPLAALCGCGAFIAIFGFSRFMFAGNFNYATPYSHEATHGILILLGLVAVLQRWLERPSSGASAGAGFLFGLTWVLKPEIMLAGAAVLVTAVLFQRLSGARWRWRWLVDAAVAAVLPTLAFAGYFSLKMGTAEAMAAAGRAWLSVLTTSRYIGDPVQLGYAGLDAPWSNLAVHLGATAAVVAIGAVIVVGGWGCERIPVRWAFRVCATLMVVAAAVGAWLIPPIGWVQGGRSFLGLLLLYLGWNGVRVLRAGSSRELAGTAWTLRFLLAVLAAALMARMILNGRV